MSERNCQYLSNTTCIKNPKDCDNCPIFFSAKQSSGTVQVPSNYPFKVKP